MKLYLYVLLMCKCADKKLPKLKFISSVTEVGLWIKYSLYFLDYVLYFKFS